MNILMDQRHIKMVPSKMYAVMIGTIAGNSHLH